MEENDGMLSASPGDSETESPPVSGGQQQATNTMPTLEKSNLDEVEKGSTGPDLLGKKKRGRPRKYDADGNLSLSYIKSSQSAALLSPPGFVMSPNSSGGYISSKKGKGRSPGSGNWQFLASLGEVFANTAAGDFMPHVVTVNTGEDVASKILTFSQKGPRGICILSANGTVSNVTIRQPCSSGGILTYEGRFEIVSLTGSFTINDNGGGVTSRSGGLSVSLAGPDGRVIGGAVAGLLTASSPIQIVMGSFMPNGFTMHKKKQRHDSPIVPMSTTPVFPDTVTMARPISEAKPDDLTRRVSTYPLLHEESNQKPSNDKKQMFNVVSSHGIGIASWNGLSPIQDHRPSPDINMSAPVE